MTTIMYIETNPILNTNNGQIEAVAVGQEVVITGAVIEDLTAMNIADVMMMKMKTADRIVSTILNTTTNIVIITQPKGEDLTKKNTIRDMMIMTIVAM